MQLVPCSLPPGFKEDRRSEILGQRAVGRAPEAEPVDRLHMSFEQRAERVGIA
jgi:hypothetical protein